MYLSTHAYTCLPCLKHINISMYLVLESIVDKLKYHNQGIGLTITIYVYTSIFLIIFLFFQHNYIEY